MLAKTAGSQVKGWVTGAASSLGLEGFPPTAELKTVSLLRRCPTQQRLASQGPTSALDTWLKDDSQLAKLIHKHVSRSEMWKLRSDLVPELVSAPQRQPRSPARRWGN